MTNCNRRNKDATPCRTAVWWICCIIAIGLLDLPPKTFLAVTLLFFGNDYFHGHWSELFTPIKERQNDE